LRRIALAVTLIAGLSLPAATSAPAARQSTTLNLVAYSTPKEAFATIIPAFQKTAAGKDVQFTQSYGPSESQARAIIAGQPADVVDLSLQPDLDSLVAKGLVAKNWNQNQYHGFVTRSVVVFVVRNGNPKHIKDWEDLIKPGVEVLTPNPFTSGGARWNVMAAYGAMKRKGKTHAQAVKYLDTLFHHVSVQDKSAREALQTFLGGKGDVLLTYENEAKLALAKGQPAYYVIPKATIRIENPVAVLKTTKNQAAAKAFVKFLYSQQGQVLFGQAGYRPVVKSALKKFSYPVRPWLFTIGYVGGWSKVQTQFFDPDNGVMAKIEKGLGQ
jgi:sulfate/thiosulfate transport system substrate-binding protein